MKRLPITTAVSLATLLASLAMFPRAQFAHENHDHSKEAKGASAATSPGAVTLSGEVLDLSCYMAHEGKGADHRKCALKCVLGGTPMGLLGADGSVTLLLETHGKPKPYKAAQQLAGMTAKVTGVKADRGGISALLLESVEKAK